MYASLVSRIINFRTTVELRQSSEPSLEWKSHGVGRGQPWNSQQKPCPMGERTAYSSRNQTY